MTYDWIDEEFDDPEIETRQAVELIRAMFTETYIAIRRWEPQPLPKGIH